MSKARDIADYSNIKGFKNHIINGGLDVWQRNSASIDSGYTTADRFFITSDADKSRSSVVPLGFSNSLLIAASASGYSVRQGIELETGLFSIFYDGSIFTYSFYIRGQAGTVLGVNAVFRDSISSSTNAVNAHLQDAAYTIQESLVWEKVEYTFTIAGDIGITNNLIELNIFSGSTSEIRMTGIQLEQGSVATPFEQRPIGLELSLCQRYYLSGFPNGIIEPTTSAIPHFIANDSSLLMGVYNFSTVMRTIPTVTLYSPVSNVINKVETPGNVEIADDFIAVGISTKGIYQLNGAGLTAGGLYQWCYIADAEL